MLCLNGVVWYQRTHLGLGTTEEIVSIKPNQKAIGYLPNDKLGSGCMNVPRRRGLSNLSLNSCQVFFVALDLEELSVLR